MSCPNNPKVFWIFKYDGPCVYEDTRIQACAIPGYFEVSQQCKNCKSMRELVFVKQQEMIRAGYSSDKLNGLSWTDRFGKSPEQLK